MKKICLVFIGLILCAFNGAAHSKEINGFKDYVVVKGDTLWKIAPKEHWDIIKRVNKIDEKHLIVGKKILIPSNLVKALKFCPVPENITEKKLSRILFIFLDIQYFSAYEKGKLLFWGPICSGSELNRTPTPKGNYRVLLKAKKYFSRECNGAPMPYSIKYSHAGHFIHQQSLPGKPASHGCVRLLMCDARKLFYWIKIGDPIKIKNFYEQ